MEYWLLSKYGAERMDAGIFLTSRLSFFETEACARFVNNVDWEASRVASVNLGGIVHSVIVQKEPTT
jgi:hypothetical protein